MRKPSSYALVYCCWMLLIFNVKSFQIGNHDNRILKQRKTSLSVFTRREHLGNISHFIFSSVASPLIASAKESNIQINLQNFSYNSHWTGTALKLLSPKQASEYPNDVYEMGRWPDPILRRPATRSNIHSLNVVNSIAMKLRKTARVNKAVGLAAQQCGIDFSIIFLDDAVSPKRKIMDQGGLFLVNPRIIDRSSEIDMKVWREECLVLPPSFRATVLRDAKVLVQYENLQGETKLIALQGEQARCLQHELDHDRGILITDHVSLDDLENDVMRNIEASGHDERQVLAYSRFIDDPIDTGYRSKDLFLAKNEEGNFGDSVREWFVPPVNAEETAASTNSSTNKTAFTANTNQASVSDDCDEDCKQKRLERIKERRAMMQQSRSTGRAEVFKLSKQRAALYGTTYQGASCPPGIPCI